MKFEVQTRGCVDGVTLKRNCALSADVPEFRGAGHLAVVGGGPSIEDNIPELRAHESLGGDIWAINDAWLWCAQKGVRAYFYSVDPQEIIADMCMDSLAALADHCSPKAYVSAKRARKLEGPHYGPTTATASLLHGPNSGYRKVTFYGCESSYRDDTHAYKQVEKDDWLCVRANGQEYRTLLFLLAQAELMAGVMRKSPIFEERCGGLLAALVADPEWEAIYGARDLVDRVNKAA